jgi:phosphatidylglycerol:prolipoprotein diacylglycerol transferase
VGPGQTDAPFGVIFCNDTIQGRQSRNLPRRPDPRHPSQLYEAALEGVLLFLILAFAVYRLKWLQRRGALVATFLIAYGLFRLSLENVRNPDRRHAQLPAGPDHGDDPVDADDPGRRLAAVAALREPLAPLARS